MLRRKQKIHNDPLWHLEDDFCFPMCHAKKYLYVTDNIKYVTCKKCLQMAKNNNNREC